MEKLNPELFIDKNIIANKNRHENELETIVEIEQYAQIRGWEIIKVRKGIAGAGLYCCITPEIHIIKTIKRKKRNGLYKMPLPIGHAGKVKFNEPKPYCNKHYIIDPRKTWFTSIPMDVYEKAVRRGLIPKTIDNIRYYLRFEIIRLKTTEIVMLSHWKYFWQNLNLLLATKT